MPISTCETASASTSRSATPLSHLVTAFDRMNGKLADCDPDGLIMHNAWRGHTSECVNESGTLAVRN